jgi:hypothetical protein
LLGFASNYYYYNTESILHFLAYIYNISNLCNKNEKNEKTKTKTKNKKQNIKIYTDTGADTDTI